MYNLQRKHNWDIQKKKHGFLRVDFPMAERERFELSHGFARL